MNHDRFISSWFWLTPHVSTWGFFFYNRGNIFTHFATYLSNKGGLALIRINEH